MKNQELEKTDGAAVSKTESSAEARRPYEAPRVVRRKSLVRATLFSGSGGGTAAAITP